MCAHQGHNKISNSRAVYIHGSLLGAHSAGERNTWCPSYSRVECVRSLFFEWSLWEFLHLHTTSMWPEWLCVPAGFVFSVALLVRKGEWANGHLAVASRAFCFGGSEIKHGFITRRWMSETRRWSILCCDHKTYQLNEKMQPSLILEDGNLGVNSEGDGQF